MIFKILFSVNFSRKNVFLRKYKKYIFQFSKISFPINNEYFYSQKYFFLDKTFYKIVFKTQPNRFLNLGNRREEFGNKLYTKLEF